MYTTNLNWVVCRISEPSTAAMYLSLTPSNSDSRSSDSTLKWSLHPFQPAFSERIFKKGPSEWWWSSNLMKVGGRCNHPIHNEGKMEVNIIFILRDLCLGSFYKSSEITSINRRLQTGFQWGKYHPTNSWFLGRNRICCADIAATKGPLFVCCISVVKGPLVGCRVCCIEGGMTHSWLFYT